MSSERNINLIMGAVAIGALGMCVAHCHESSQLKAELVEHAQDERNWFAQLDRDLPGIEAYLKDKIYDCMIEPGKNEGEYVCVSFDGKSKYFLTKERMTKALVNR